MKFFKRSFLIIFIILSTYLCIERVNKNKKFRKIEDNNNRRLKIYSDEEKNLVNNYLTEISVLKNTIANTNLEEVNIYELEEQISKVKVALMILAKMGSAHYKKDKINNRKLNEIFNEIKHYRKKYQDLSSTKNKIIDQIHQCSNKLNKIVQKNKVTDDEKKELLLKLTKEINALKRMQSFENIVKGKNNDLNGKYSKLKELANTETLNFKSKFNKYYDQVSSDLGIELRQLNEINQKGLIDYSNETNIADSINKDIKKIRNKVLTTIDEGRSFVGRKNKINTKLMALVNNQAELENLVEETANKEDDHIRDTRSRAIKILREYNKDLRTLNIKKKVRHIKKAKLSNDKRDAILPDDEEELVNEIERDIDNINAISNDNIKVLSKGKKSKKSSIWYKQQKVKLLNLRNLKLSRDISKLEKKLVAKLHERWNPKNVNK
jgi:hypothetical protein